MSTHYEAGAAAGEYSLDDDNQLQPADTLVDRGVDDVLDEGFSPPEQPYGPGAFRPSESWTSCLPRKSRIRRHELMSGSTKRSSNAPTRLSVKPNFPSHVKSAACEQVGLSRQTGGLAKTQRRSW